MSCVRHSDRADAQRGAAPDQSVRQRPQGSTAPGASDVSLPARALALQRAVGNRAAGRVLARWSKHPDEKEKGKLLSDDAAVDYMHFNVPLNK